jgi:hypothetical protein
MADGGGWRMAADEVPRDLDLGVLIRPGRGLWLTTGYGKCRARKELPMDSDRTVCRVQPAPGQNRPGQAPLCLEPPSRLTSRPDR